MSGSTRATKRMVEPGSNTTLIWKVTTFHGPDSRDKQALKLDKGSTVADLFAFAGDIPPPRVFHHGRVLAPAARLDEILHAGSDLLVVQHPKTTPVSDEERKQRALGNHLRVLLSPAWSQGESSLTTTAWVSVVDAIGVLPRPAGAETWYSHRARGRLDPSKSFADLHLCSENPLRLWWHSPVPLK